MWKLSELVVGMPPFRGIDLPYGDIFIYHVHVILRRQNWVSSSFLKCQVSRVIVDLITISNLLLHCSTAKNSGRVTLIRVSVTECAKLMTYSVTVRIIRRRNRD